MIKIPISRILRDDPEEAKRQITEALYECSGNVARVAHSFGMHRVDFWGVIRRLDLWPAVVAARKAKGAP